MKIQLVAFALLLWIGIVRGNDTDQPLTSAALTRLTFEQNLGQILPPKLSFLDDQGNQVHVGNYLGSGPIVLTLGYYQCPMLCNLALNGLVHALQEINSNDDVTVIFVSVDPKETVNLAAAKKAIYLKRLGRRSATDQWHFLTSDA